MSELTKREPDPRDQRIAELERIRAEIEVKDKGETMGKADLQKGQVRQWMGGEKRKFRLTKRWSSGQWDYDFMDQIAGMPRYGGAQESVILAGSVPVEQTMDNDKAQLEKLGAWNDRVFTPEQRAVALLKESRDIFTYQAPECMYAHAKDVRIAERINRALENLGAVSEGEKPIVRTQENVQVGDVRRVDGDDEEVLHVASEDCDEPVLIRWRGPDSKCWHSGIRALKQMEVSPLQNPTDSHGNPIKQEPEHAFPDSDDDLVGEMFEDGEGEVFIVAVCGVFGGACFNVNKDCCVWRTLEAIRSYKPLGPSPEKRKRMAMERVCEAAEQWREADQNGGCAVQMDARDELYDALEARDALAKVEGATDES